MSIQLLRCGMRPVIIYTVIVDLSAWIRNEGDYFYPGVENGVNVRRGEFVEERVNGRSEGKSILRDAIATVQLTTEISKP